MVSSSALIEAQPPSADAKTATTMQAAAASRLGRMVRKNYNADWDAGFGAPMEAMVPAAMGGRRLDQATSGWLGVAKTAEAQLSLVGQLEEGSVRRIYLAGVQGAPPASGVIDAPVGRDTRSRVRMAVSHRGKQARTNYRVLERYGYAALVECRLETGRTHQIRVHFQHIRHPLVGDTVYRRGTRHGLSFPRQALHAAELSLVHPTTNQVLTWKSALPRDMKKLVGQLRHDDRA